MHYELTLPVYKQGDDFDRYLHLNDGDSIEALRSLAAQYRDASERCDDLAAYLDHHHIPTSMGGETHWIWLDSPESLDSLTVVSNDISHPLLTIIEVNDSESISDEDSDITF